MRRTLALLLLLLPVPAAATTWYVRTDGGTATQCTGTTNAPYPGSGSAQPCGVNHPFWLLNQSTFAWLIAGGDTVQFEDVGPYYIGQQGASGLGSTWPTFCTGNAPNCNFPPLPNGSAGNPTRFLGLGAGNCHQTDPNLAGPAALTNAWAGHGKLKNATQLLGINGVFWVLSVQNSSFPDVECFDISQPTTCTRLGNGTNCTGSTMNDWANHGIFFEYHQSGTLTLHGPINGVFKDLAIHGISNEGISGGHFNTLSTDTTTMSDIYIQGNGGAGWDYDGGSCGTSCESVGTINVNWLRIEWNGCVEVKPNGGAIGGAGFNLCFDDNNSGYGDGLAIIATQGTWVVNHGIYRWNTQDGLDMLHTSDDLAHLPTSITVSNSWSEGNEGQTFKAGASSNTLFYNNVSISNCRRLGSPFAPNPSGYNTGLSDFCRAAGDEWAVGILNGNVTTFEHNTSIGYGATMFDLTCPAGGTCSTTTQVIFKDNINFGKPDPGRSNTLAGGFQFTGGASDPFSNAGSAIDHNNWFNVLSGGVVTCPQDAAETSAVCTDPLLTSESSIDAITPTLTASSPGKGAGVAIGGQTVDFNGLAWDSPPSIGAYKFGSILIIGSSGQ